MTIRTRQFWIWKVASAVLCLPAALQGQSGGAERKKASDLIKLLTYQTDRPHSDQVRSGLFGCGQVAADVPLALSLIRIGPPALPMIEAALDPAGYRANGVAIRSFWVEWAYAAIKGPDAFLRLHALERLEALGLGRYNFDGPIALSLGLTSYVSDSRHASRSISCFRGPEPRDALDRIILGWETNNRTWLESGLGPAAKVALDEFVNGRSWSSVTSEFGEDQRVGRAVGYRFEIRSRWADPEPELRQDDRPVDFKVTYPHFRIPTLFKTAGGIDCGRISVEFFGVEPRPDSAAKYFVDSTNIVEILKLVSSCAQEK